MKLSKGMTVRVESGSLVLEGVVAYSSISDCINFESGYGVVTYHPGKTDKIAVVSSPEPPEGTIIKGVVKDDEVYAVRIINDTESGDHWIALSYEHLGFSYDWLQFTDVEIVGGLTSKVD